MTIAKAGERVTAGDDWFEIRHVATSNDVIKTPYEWKVVYAPAIVWTPYGGIPVGDMNELRAAIASMKLDAEYGNLSIPGDGVSEIRQFLALLGRLAIDLKF